MATAAKHKAFHARKNDRGCDEVSHDGHISIEDLIIDLQDENNKNKICNDFRRLGITYELKILDYLTRNIPNYPTPVEFHISEVSHVTHIEGLYGIWESEGFRSQADGDQEKLLWWSLKIDEDSKRAAEERYLETVFPDRSQEQKERQESFLSKFTTSPVFSNESRYGNFRFTLPLKELMDTYKEQMCGGQNPVLREYKTIFYKQEIMYAVLIHSPEDNERFENFPTIENSPFVSFVDHESTVWKAQAIGNRIEFQLTLNEEDKTAIVEPKSTRYYVWDHVCLAFHFDEVLKFPKETLKKICTPCKLSEMNVAKGTCCPYEEAQEILRNLH